MVESVEMDQLIAVNIMGWGVWNPEFSNVGVYLTENDMVTYQFSPSTKENDAFKVVEKLKGKRKFMLLDQLDESGHNKYTALFQYYKDGLLKEDKGCSENVSKAISLAALKTVGVID